MLFESNLEYLNAISFWIQLYYSNSRSLKFFVCTRTSNPNFRDNCCFTKKKNSVQFWGSKNIYYHMGLPFHQNVYVFCLLVSFWADLAILMPFHQKVYVFWVLVNFWADLAILMHLSIKSRIGLEEDQQRTPNFGAIFVLYWSNSVHK